MATCDAAYDLLEQYRIVCSLKWVGNVQQIDFELPRSVFGNRRIGRYVLRGAGGINIVEEALEVVELA